mmetsp:Transcript_20143/g.44975  ORF Transcript_20143/g.44975 Transcript_20143/m.44975 type:complete len:218 (-) Transcript_20143:434-1087(-)
MRVAWGERGMGMAACVNGTAAGCDIRGHCASRGANGSATQEKRQGSGEEADMATQHPPCTSILLSPPPLTPPLTSHHSRNCFSSKAVSSRKVTSAFTSSIDSVPSPETSRRKNSLSTSFLKPTRILPYRSLFSLAESGRIFPPFLSFFIWMKSHASDSCSITFGTLGACPARDPMYHPNSSTSMSPLSPCDPISPAPAPCTSKSVKNLSAWNSLPSK